MRHKIEVRNITKIFGADPASALSLLQEGANKSQVLKKTDQTVGVHDVSFDVEQGQIFVVMGLSGSGKSTLVRMLNRLIPPTTGEVWIDGENIVTASKAHLRSIRLEKIAMVFQHFALFPHKSVLQNAEYGLKIKGVEPSRRAEQAMTALKQVGLDAWADRPTKALSGGMQQRVGLARALAVDPDILLMDEPFSALDPLIRREMQNELLELQHKVKKTIVFITHDLNEALVLGDRIAIMKEGAFVQVGTAEEIVGRPADDYVSKFTQDIDRGRVFSVDSIMENAHSLDAATVSPAAALEELEKLNREALHVTRNGQLAGLVTYADVNAALQNGQSDLNGHVRAEAPATREGTPIHQIYRLCAQGLPVAVVGEDGALLGAVTPQAVFRQLVAESPSEAGAFFEQARERSAA